ncbi:MAG: PASTA domain-containing protein [Bacteroidales bacterium]|nr:PASTA domain-containing protein [Bacteroidales bacterium]MBO6220458.1 PASTA domain-containing protein [Bacteroidales bacterium]MBQ5979925.1 PASTA domain-containing protein [Bacteroidales bacterium]MBQ6184277.1 PASTA domain-containing protein [Bacteroidales bacterium]
MEEEKIEKKGFFSNWIVRNLIGAVVFFAVLLIAATVILGIITHHGQTIEVPDLTNMSVDNARHEASREDLRIEVIDSIYVRRMQKGAVYSQNPKAGTKVKKGRRIMLTINAMNAKKVSMPNLVGYSMRQAKAELNARGLALGKLIYVNDIATNNVLRQIYHNREIRPGRQIETGSEIDLQVGLNPSDNMTYVPNVKGMKYLRAVDAVHDNSLNLGKVVFDKTVKNYTDSLNATVYKQSPGASKSPLLMGSDVTIHLSLDIKENY